MTRAGLVTVWAVLLALALIAPDVASEDQDDFRVRQTVRVSLAFWFAALLVMPSADTGRLARLLWTLAWAAFVVHVGVAFHHAHHWSHAEAFRHVEEVSGFGYGIFVSYAFTLMWTLDVFRWWVRGPDYRPPWWWLAFMLFVTFNGTVVYETGFIRWAGLGMFVILAGREAVRRRRPPDRGSPP